MSKKNYQKKVEELYNTVTTGDCDKVSKLVKEHHTDINTLFFGRYKYNLLMRCIQFPNNEKMFDLLIELGIKPFLKDVDGDNIVHHWAKYGKSLYFEKIKDCLGQKLSEHINMRNILGYTPIFDAAQAHNITQIKILLEHNIDLSLVYNNYSGAVGTIDFFVETDNRSDPQRAQIILDMLQEKRISQEREGLNGSIITNKAVTKLVSTSKI